MAENKPKIDLAIAFDYNSANISANSLRTVEALGRALVSPELKGSVFKADERPIDQWPMVFSKVPESVIAPGAAIRLPGSEVKSWKDS